MSLRRGLPVWLCLAVLAAAAHGQTAITVVSLPDSGVLDRSGQLSPTGTHDVDQACARLHNARRISLLVVLDGTPREGEVAATLLERWAPAVQEGATAAVLHLVLASKAADLAMTPSLSAVLPDEVRANLLESSKVRGALANGSPALLANGLVALADRLVEATAALATARPTAAELPRPAVPRPWLNPLAWVLAPALLFGLLAWWREGCGAALRLLPGFLMLYAGLYLMLRFYPVLFKGLGFLAVAPVLVLAARPAGLPVAALLRAADQWCRGRGGFGLLGWGALGQRKVL